MRKREKPETNAPDSRKINLTLTLQTLQDAGLVSRHIDVARRIVVALQATRHAGRKASTILNMLYGKDRLQSYATKALIEAFGLARYGIDEAMLADAGAVAARLRAAPAAAPLRLLKSWSPPVGRAVTFEHTPLATMRAAEETDGVCALAAYQTHPFALTSTGFRAPHAILLEFGRAEAEWWSLMGHGSTRLDGRPLEFDARLRERADLTIRIGGEPTAYDLFALVSEGPFPLEVFDFIPLGEPGKLTPRIREADLLAWLSQNRGALVMAVASFAYRASA